MVGYRLQPGCWCCKHTFCKTEYEESSQLYCKYKAPKRPKCGSVAMKGEAWPLSVRDEKRFTKCMKEWDRWSRPRRVSEFSICDAFKISSKAVIGHRNWIQLIGTAREVNVINKFIKQNGVQINDTKTDKSRSKDS